MRDVLLLALLILRGQGITQTEGNLSKFKTRSLALSPLSQQLYAKIDEIQLKDVDEELCALAQVHGFQNRTGMLPYEYGSLRPAGPIITKYVNGWHEKRHQYVNDYVPPFPLHSCIPVISHKYKFIYIAMPKTGFSTTSHFFRNQIGDGGFKEGVFEKVMYTNMTEEMYSQYYKNYFTFTFTRNPYNRAVSLYFMMTGEFLQDDAGYKCGPSFQEFCQDPYKLKEMCGKHYKQINIGNETGNCCCYTNGNLNQGFLDQHSMPQSPCVFNQNGEIMVDFVGRTETYQEDIQTILEEVNKRSENKIPIPLKVEAKYINQKLGAQNSTCDHISQKYSDLYKKFPECQVSIQKYYHLDFKLFDYQYN